MGAVLVPASPEPARTRRFPLGENRRCRQVLQLRPDALLGDGEIELCLEAHPELGLDAEPGAESQSRVGTH